MAYFATAVENYLPYMARLDDPSIGHYVMDMVANVLGVEPGLMARARAACRRIVDVITNVTARAEVPAGFSHHGDRLVVERFSPSPYDGMTCTWYSNTGAASGGTSYLNRYMGSQLVFLLSETFSNT